MKRASLTQTSYLRFLCYVLELQKISGPSIFGSVILHVLCESGLVSLFNCFPVLLVVNLKTTLSLSHIVPQFHSQENSHSLFPLLPLILSLSFVLPLPLNSFSFQPLMITWSRKVHLHDHGEVDILSLPDLIKDVVPLALWQTTTNAP